jgi:hypothetical protein
MTIAQGLRLRGADVRYVMCDGLFSDCDVFWKAVDPRPADACMRCMAGTTALAAQNGMPYQFLGRYLDPQEARTARKWVTSLRRDELLSAVYGDWAIAEWVRGSIHSHFRHSRLDITDREVERTTRSYLYSGLIAAFAIERLLDDYQPDVLLLFNGRQSSTRVAFELARRRAIRVVCHERGMRRGTMWFSIDRTIISRTMYGEYWDQWGDVPLTVEELRAVTGHLSEREHGVNTGCVAFSPVPQDQAALRASLGLSEDRPVWALFTSSDDEVVSEDEWRPSWPQEAWIAKTLDFARRHPEIDLVVRVHPNIGSRRSVGANQQQLQWLEELSRDLPPNVRWVGPRDDVSSYTLMDLATVGLVSHSTVALEIATKGKHVIVSAPNAVTDMPFVRTEEAPEGYEAALDAALDLDNGATDDEVRRLALRFAYGFFFRLSVEFPLVASRADAIAERNWKSLDELKPGRDAVLDRCTAMVLDNGPVYPAPTAADLARSDEAERRFLAPRQAVLAYAEELIEDVSLLELWGDAVTVDDPVTLLVHTPPSATEALIAAVQRAGLERDDAPDMIAVSDDDPGLAAVTAVLSRHDEPGLLRLDTPAAVLQALA